MTCSEYVERFSEIQDGIVPPELARQAEDHLASCPACTRYRRVLERGTDLLRSLPAPEVHEDFVPRLQHRLYHVDHEEMIRRHTGSGTTALAVLGMAVLMVAVAWAPALRPTAPVVELPPLVVNRPPPAARARALTAFSAFAAQPLGAPVRAGLWGDAGTLLFQYSRLAQRYGQRPIPGRRGEEDQ